MLISQTPLRAVRRSRLGAVAYACDDDGGNEVTIPHCDAVGTCAIKIPKTLYITIFDVIVVNPLLADCFTSLEGHTIAISWQGSNNWTLTTDANGNFQNDIAYQLEEPRHNYYQGCNPIPPAPLDWPFNTYTRGLMTGPVSFCRLANGNILINPSTLFIDTITECSNFTPSLCLSPDFTWRTCGKYLVFLPQLSLGVVAPSIYELPCARPINWVSPFGIFYITPLPFTPLATARYAIYE